MKRPTKQFTFGKNDIIGLVPSTYKAKDFIKEKEDMLSKKLLHAYHLRREGNMNLARLNFCTSLCLNDLSNFSDYEKVRMFFEFKTFLYFRAKYDEEFIKEVYDRHVNFFKNNPFGGAPPTSTFSSLESFKTSKQSELEDEFCEKIKSQLNNDLFRK